MTTRGPGKVVPLRPVNPAGSSSQRAHAPATDGDLSALQDGQQAKHVAHLTASNQGRDSTAPACAVGQLPTPPAAASDTRCCPATAPFPQQHQPSSSTWRCAPWLQRPPRAGELAEVWPKQLTGAAAAAALRAGRPVLFRGTALSCCHLRQSSVPEAPVPSKQQLGSKRGQEQDEDELPSVWRRQWAGSGGASSSSKVAAGAGAAVTAAVEGGGQAEVLASPARVARFVRCDVSKNTPGSYYELLRPGRWGAPLPGVGPLEWRDRWLTWAEHLLLLTVHVCNWEVVATPTGGAAARVTPNPAAWGELLELLQPQIAEDDRAPDAGRRLADGLLDWQQLQLILTAGSWASAGSATLQAGPGRGCLLPARYETHDTLVVQLEGSRRVLLLPPEQAFRGLVPYPVAHPYDGYCCINMEDPEVEHWPCAENVRGFVVDLQRGDTLLIPAYWFAHTQLGSGSDDDWAHRPSHDGSSHPAASTGQQGGSAALLLRLQPSAPAAGGATAVAEVGAAAALAAVGRLLPDGALQLQAARMVEAVVGAEVGAANVRRWLLLLAEGREMQGLQLGTPRGYRRLRMCEIVMEQLQCVLRLLDADTLKALVEEGQAALLRGRTTHPTAPVVPYLPHAAGGAPGNDAVSSSQDQEATPAGPTAPQSPVQNVPAPAGLLTARGGAMNVIAGACGSLVEAAARALLALMCDGRLIPTDWLNEGVDVQRHLLIEPDAEAARYPQLFRHRLLSEQTDWKTHARLLPPKCDVTTGLRGALTTPGAMLATGNAVTPRSSLALPVAGSEAT